MCTHFKLIYSCNHIVTSTRCPRTNFASTTPILPLSEHEHESQNQRHSNIQIANGYRMQCRNQLVLERSIDDECMECKVGKGAAPGLATGMDRWAGDEEVERGIRYRMKNEGLLLGGRVGEGLIGETIGFGNDGRTSTAQGLALKAQGRKGKTEMVDPVQEKFGGVEGDDAWMWGDMSYFGDGKDPN